ncbi:MAG TPA: hypothetical protein VJR05_06945, partial [Acidimicrobiia bacterium]|nr:hypothetical protein [Acidimicrobiia bacterium]
MVIVQMFATITTRSIDSLEQELLSWQAEKARASFQQLPLIRQLDQTQVWLADGCKNMAAWISSRLDLPQRIARDLLYVARAHHQLVEEWLETGEIGLERAVALIRLHRTSASPELMEASRGIDLGGLWRLVASRERL